MMNIFLVPAILLFIAAVADLLFIAREKTGLRVFSKPAILPLLVFLYFSLTLNPRWFLFAGLFAGWVGDILLLKKSKGYFVSGIISFLIGHIFYSIAILRDLEAFPTGVGMFTVILGFVVLGWLVLRYIWPDEPAMQIPVTVYALGLSVLGLSAAARLIALGNASSIVIAIGALLFIVSDSLLGIQQFKGSFKHDQSVIMISYIIAQIMIVMGFVLA